MTIKIINAQQQQQQQTLIIERMPSNEKQPIFLFILQIYEA